MEEGWRDRWERVRETEVHAPFTQHFYQHPPPFALSHTTTTDHPRQSDQHNTPFLATGLGALCTITYEVHSHFFSTTDTSLMTTVLGRRQNLFSVAQKLSRPQQGECTIHGAGHVWFGCDDVGEGVPRRKVLLFSRFEVLWWKLAANGGVLCKHRSILHPTVYSALRNKVLILSGDFVVKSFCSNFCQFFFQNSFLAY